jgi:large subunit ribosomal protein L11
MEFCKIFNQQTKNIVASVYIPTTVTIWSNGTFQVLIKTPTTTRILKQTAEFENNAVAKITLKEIYHIGNLKQSDRILSFLCKKAICKMIVGSIKSIGSLSLK